MGRLMVRIWGALLGLCLAFLVGVGTHVPGVSVQRFERSVQRYALINRLRRVIQKKEAQDGFGDVSVGSSQTGPGARGRVQLLPSRTFDSGYNCRAAVYLGRSDEPWETVFDTGSTRNAVSAEFLHELAVDPRNDLRQSILKVWSIKKLSCVGMEADRSTQVEKAVTLRITFREHGIGRSVTQDLDFMVFPGLSERIILGNPTLNELGFASTKHSIELRAYGVEFPTILPDKEKRPEGEKGLRINSHYNVQPLGSSWMVQTVWCRPDKSMYAGFDDVPAGSSQTERKCKDNLWLQDGLEPVPGAQVIEGPATIVDGRVPVQLLCTRTVQFGPGNKMVDIRERTPHDDAVLKAINRCDKLQARRDQALETCKKEAAHSQHH